MDANVGHEVSTIKGEWLDRSDRNFFDWLRDTYLDMKDIVYGYRDGLNVTGPCEGRYVPGDCCLRSSPCCRCRLMYGR